ncbi:SPFH domain, Band 7 family protein [Magnetococcus marinus MC-1]|uniref:Protein QmcA n=1 Tax=Magnetococcus marinus (strain ATCC BAA-1437 / JCM 17883 / MC-1) TaxID=156889 RepID=A0L7L2_MAGMM|nr:SPFH domain-containing protein [Magnetococcus marinus]ABK43955.1 SPFH domain, Band 7 family protein [Magnetococcus marinus MC-1]
MIGGFSLFSLVLLMVIVLLIFMGVKTVPQGYHYTVERFGKFTKILRPGLNFITPFLDAVTHKINMREQVLDIDAQSVISSDNAVVQADGVVFYQIVDAARSSYEISDLHLAMRNLCMTNIRSVLGAMSLDQMLSNRDEINSKLLGVIDQATDPWGVKVTRVEIKDLEPPMDLVEAMSMQMKAERTKRAQILEAEGYRQAAILQAEGEKQGAILKAEGDREAAFRQAEARERLAEAEANATRMVSDAVKDGNVQALNYFVATKYTDALQNMASAQNSKVIMMPLEASSILGSLAGISELARLTKGE